jgi:hypothetical protein
LKVVALLQSHNFRYIGTLLFVSAKNTSIYQALFLAKVPEFSRGRIVLSQSALTSCTSLFSLEKKDVQTTAENSIKQNASYNIFFLHFQGEKLMVPPP